MHLRRTIALATGAIALAALTSCGFDYATDRPYTPANGVNDRDGSVDVLNAVIVSTEEGSGTFVATFANNNPTEGNTVEALEAAGDSDVTAEEFETIEVPAGGMVNLAEEGGIPVTGDFAAGDFVEVSLTFGGSEIIDMDVHVVTNCGDFAGLDGPEDAEQCEAPEPAVEH
jgi:hypothetical protein